MCITFSAMRDTALVAHMSASLWILETRCDLSAHTLTHSLRRTKQVKKQTGESSNEAASLQIFWIFDIRSQNSTKDKPRFHYCKLHASCAKKCVFIRNQHDVMFVGNKKKVETKFRLWCLYLDLDWVALLLKEINAGVLTGRCSKWCCASVGTKYKYWIWSDANDFTMFI